MYNEVDRLEKGLYEILEYMSNVHSNAEIILVDDGSTDDTFERAQTMLRSFNFEKSQVLRFESNRGKGAAVKKGMLTATGDIRAFVDADNATPIEELTRVLPMITTLHTIVIGSRGLKESRIETSQVWWRQSMGKIFNLFPRVLLGLPYKDTQCGFKVFGAKAAEICFQDQYIERFAFDAELLWIAKIQNLNVLEVPVRWRHVDFSRVNPLKDSMKMAWDALRIRWIHPQL